MSISPQGYTLGGDPQNINPFWGEDEQTNWTIEAEATVDNTSGSPSVNVETDTDTTLKKKTFTFEFSGLKGADGTNGVGITSIAKTGTSELVDTYTITFTNGTTATFTVTNGTSGTDGVGISSIQKTGTSGLVDTYTITLTNGETDTFTVTNGSNGTTPVITITATEGGAPITVTKTGTDAAPSFNFAFTGGGGSGSTVSVTQIQTTGTKIATITVDNVDTDLYAPEGGGGGSGTIEADATVKWAGKALTTQPTTYPYKRTQTVTSIADSGNVTPTGQYTFYDDINGVNVNVNITFDVDYTLYAGSAVSIIVYHDSNLTSSRSYGGNPVTLTNNGATSDDASNIIGELINPTVSGTGLYAYFPSSVSLEYNGNTYTATYTGGLLRTQLASDIATTTTTYDVMEAIGIGLVVNESDFSAITSSKVVNKLKCTFENASYYIQQIPAVKLNDGTTSSLSITAGAAILYFDNFEYIDVTSTSYAYGKGTLRIVVPNSGGEWFFDGTISIGHINGNSISVILGRGSLTKSDGTAYFVTGNASAFTINTTTSTVSNVYMELV